MRQFSIDFDDNETTKIGVDLIDRYQCSTCPTASIRGVSGTILD